MPLRVSDLPPGLAAKLGLTQKRVSKYGNVAVVSDGYRFDSLKEERRYRELRVLERVGAVENVQCQPQFYITRDGQVIATYRADFRYLDRRTRQWVIEDVKSEATRRKEAYRLRKALVESQYGVLIQEV